MSERLRPIFEIYVDDSRYAVPTLHLAPAVDFADAERIVERLIAESEHHVGAEICFDGQQLAAFGSFALSPRLRTA
jgi:hypothetical protein